MPHPVRPFLGESAESRVQARRRLLMDKSFELLAAGEWRHASIAQLCRDVNLNKRYFYESFADLDALEDAVVDDLTSTLMVLGLGAAETAQQQGMDTGTLARHVLATCLRWLIEDPRRAQVLFAKVSDNTRARDQRSRVIDQLAQTLTGFGVAYHQPRQPRMQPHETLQHLAHLSAAMLIGGTIESILRWLDGDIPLPLDAFIDYIARFWVVLGDAAVDMARHLAPPDAPPQG